MFWEENIDILKKEADPKDFKVPFTDWRTILKKIEDKFVVKENSNLRFSKWDSRLKDKQKIKELLTGNIDAEFNKLDPNQNYWIVLTRERADFKNLIYDSKPAIIKKIFGLWAGDFYIVDKKYKWLTYFKVSSLDVEVFKSGDQMTPLDSK